MPYQGPSGQLTRKQETMFQSRRETREQPRTSKTCERLALSGVVEQHLSDNSAEEAELEYFGVVAEGALGEHHTRDLGTIISSVGAFDSTLDALRCPRGSCG